MTDMPGNGNNNIGGISSSPPAASSSQSNVTIDSTLGKYIFIHILYATYPIYIYATYGYVYICSHAYLRMYTYG